MKKGLLVLLFLLSQSAMGAWQDWFQTPDARGVAALEAQKPLEAAEHFHSPDWRGVANYQGQNYAAAIQDFAQGHDPQSQYNLGNALAQAGQLSAAVKQYEKVLASNPKHADAQYNRDLVKKLLEQQQQNKQPKQSPQKNHDSSEQKQAASKPGRQNPQNGQKKAQEKAQNSKPQQAQKDKQNESAQQAQQENRTAPPPQDDIDKWLGQIKDDPAGLLRRKFMRDHQRGT